MVERYIEITDEYVKQLEQEIDNLKKINEEHKKINGELREQNKKYKEVIDKISSCIKLLGKYDGQSCTRGFSMMTADFNKLLDILKEVK